VFAAGDVTHISEQVLVHTGELAKAAVEAHAYLLELKSQGQQGTSSRWSAVSSLATAKSHLCG